MLRLILATFLLLSHLLVLAGCRGQAADDPIGQANAATPASTAIIRTEFSDRLMNLMEFEPLRPGQASPFLLHLTDLQSGRPVAEAKLTLHLRGPNGRRLASFPATPGANPGIYHSEVQAPDEGTWGLDVEVHKDGLNETMALEGLVVSSAPTAPASPAADPPGDSVAFLMEQQWQVELKLAAAQRETIARPLSVTGRLVPAANSHNAVASPVAGTVLGQRLPRVGQTVSLGQVLAVVGESATAIDRAQLQAAQAQVDSAHRQTVAQIRSHNAEVRTQNAQSRLENARLQAERETLKADLASAQARQQRAEAEVTRARQVYAVQGISEKELRAVELQNTEARKEVEALQARQAALAKLPPFPTNPLLDEPPLTPPSVAGGSQRQVLAPYSGLVTEVYKSWGEQVAAGEPILDLADLRVVWLECPVFEKDLGRLSPGMEATFTVLAYPGKSFRGRLVDVGSVIHEQTRAAKAIFEVANEDRQLKLGMQADVRLASSETMEAMLIPKEAVLDREGKTVVYVLRSGEEFERREVTVAADLGLTVSVTSGLKPGERVVSQGAYQLFLQESQPDGAAAHSHEH